MLTKIKDTLIHARDDEDYLDDMTCDEYIEIKLSKLKQ